MIIAVQTLLFFRESIFAVIDRLLRPYYKHFSLPFINNNISDYEESEEYVCAEFDDERGVMFFPPVYAQRYAAVTDCLMDERWNGNLEKVVDFGCHDTSFIKYLKEVPGISTIYGVDIESIPLQFLSDPLASDELAPKRETPLHLILFQGNASDPDYRLIGCDAVVAIEMIEHMLPHDLERLVHTIFGFIKPRVAVITTPNGDFNPLFKNLEKNGLRLLDHFFEWSREQFHDWCSNIVTRYPLYTVSCKGVGPGPPGTQQYGCCSQLALFVSKDYHKQQDLNLNSLALIPNDASCNKVCQFEYFDSVDNITENNTIYSPNELNCTTLQVKKFSKTAQNILAKNKIDTFVHTKEVLDEIRHLAKMLNLDNSVEKVDGTHTWQNFNWGENAPYWNQYYKVIGEYTYPLQIKTEESLIIDLISDEINRLEDTQYDEDFAVGVDKFEIPIEHLMKVVQHVTDDVEMVKDLLEWNGYEVVGDVVIHPRLVVDAASPESQDEWRHGDTFSDVNKYILLQTQTK